ncbi:MAG: membrane protein insertion efficiency factor YidD [Alphaproteobacteria bacterium]|nr:membrane protein insertion efficiency factor YidD [Alphaproteobacteria bacterium]
MKFVLIQIIKFYSFVISPLLGKNCRFYPTCSAYAVQAIERHGVFKGMWLASRRILKCHPWYRGNMVDEVPAQDCTCSRDRV